MKKILTSFLAIALALVSLLGATGCNKATQLNFTSEFSNSNEELSPEYSETVTYDVSYVKDYNSSLSRDSAVTDELLDLDVTGTYVTELSIVNNLPSQAKSKISTENSYILYFTTDLALTVTVNGQTFNDRVVTDAYFLSAGMSFAPLYTKVSNDSTNISLKSSANSPAKVVTSKSYFIYVTDYQNENYTVNKYTFDNEQAFEQGITAGKHMNGSPATYDKKDDYYFRSVVDNTQLMFLIRNLGLNKEASSTLPVIAPAYGVKSNIVVNNQSENKKNLLIDIVSNSTNVVNGEVEFLVKNLVIKNGSTKNSGTPHFAILQKKPSDVSAIPFNSLLLEYAHVLTDTGSARKLGALKYTILSVSING